MTYESDRNTTERRRSAPTTSRPANRPTSAPKKPSAARTAPPVQASPRDARDSERSLPQPLRAVAYGAGAVIGVTTKVAEEVWHAGGRLVDRVRGNR